MKQAHTPETNEQNARELDAIDAGGGKIIVEIIDVPDRKDGGTLLLTRLRIDAPTGSKFVTFGPRACRQLRFALQRAQTEFDRASRRRR